MAKIIFRIKPIKRRHRIRREVMQQTGRLVGSHIKKRRALPAGWRVSKTGHEYYEARRNRSRLPSE